MSAATALPALPPSMPQYGQNAWRRFCAWLLRRCGWRLAGALPDRPKLVLIAAPHSSWWDGFWGLLCRSALGANVAFMAKRELFAGPLGWLLRRAGGIPIERRSAPSSVSRTFEAQLPSSQALRAKIVSTLHLPFERIIMRLAGVDRKSNPPSCQRNYYVYT